MKIVMALCTALLISSLQPALAAANQYTGTWNIEPAGKPGYVNLRMEYHAATETWEESNDVPRSQLAGVSAADFNSPGERKRFTIRRDAGEFQAEGWFAHGGAAGTWTFFPSESFRGELARRGIGAPDDRRQFQLAMSGFTISTLDALSAAGFERPSVSDLIRMFEHGVSKDYVAAMRAVPLHPKTVDELIRMRDHGVSAQFAADMLRSNPRLSGEDLVDLRDHGVSAGFMRALAQDGYGTVSAQDATRLRDHGVSVEYLQGLQHLGYHPSVDDLVRLADHGVSIAFIERMRSHGYSHLSAADLIRLRDHGF